MEINRELTSTKLKTWVKSFVGKFDLRGSVGLTLEEMIRLFESRYQRRFVSVRYDINRDFSLGTEWLGEAIAGQMLSLTDSVRQQFTDYLMGRVLNTDVVVTTKSCEGDGLTVSIEVQANGREPQGPTYANVAEVRKLLGIDKHLILVLDNQTDQLPKHSKLMQEINAFCAEEIHAKTLNLTDLDPWDLYDWHTEYEGDPGRMWTEYSEGIIASASNLIALEAAKQAFRDGHSPESVFQMLRQEPMYLELLKRDCGDPKFADMHAKAISYSAEINVAQEEQQPEQESPSWDRVF